MKIRTYFITLIFTIFFVLITLDPEAGAANKIMPLGDSITKGSSSGVVDEALQVSYRQALYDRLETAGYVVNGEIFVGTLFSGESVPDFDPDHDGHDGWRTDQIVDGNLGNLSAGKLSDWLIAQEPNIVLLHIGTNDVNGGDENWTEVEDLLVVIDDYETTSGKAVWVVLALIIEQSCLPPLAPPCPKTLEITNFNDDVRDFVFVLRLDADDKIILVDMQNDAGIIYDRWNLGGDMFDTLHPFEFGYEKMADLWFSGLMEILPRASAGPDRNVNEFDSVTLDGSGSSDPKGDNLSYQWVQTAGTPIVNLLPNAQAVQPTFEAPDAGLTGKILTFTLTVTDVDELVSTDRVNVAVAKIVPQANAGPDQTVKEGAEVELDASGSVGVGLSYQWVQTDGTPVVDLLPNAQAVQPTFAAPENVGPTGKTLTFELTVIDGDGIDSTDTVDITVKIAPLADAGPDQTVGEFDTVTLDASGSAAAGGGILSYQWTQTTGTDVGTINNADTITATFTAPDVAAAGETLTFQVTVKDVDNLESADTVDIIVKIPPLADAGPDQNVDEFDTVTLDASGSAAAGGGSLSYQWAQTAGTDVGAINNADTITATFTAPDVAAAGETLTFQVTVKDVNNLESTDMVNISVRNPTSSDGGGGGGGGGGCFITTATSG